MAPPAVAPATANNPQPGPVNRFSARSSYHGPTGYHPSEGLKRARRPFRFRNAVTGLAIMGFVTSVYAYSISAVKQDDFSDLPKVSPVAGEGVKTIEEELEEKSRLRQVGNRGIGAMMGLGSSPQGEGVRIVQDQQPLASNLSQSASPDSLRFPSPQPTPLSTPLPPNSKAAREADSLPAAPVNRNARTGERQQSHWIAGAPDVDRVGRLGDRRLDEPTIAGKRVV